MAVEAPRTVKHLRVKVVDHLKEGEPAVNIKIPIGIVNFGMKMAKAFSPEMKDVEVDWDSVASAVEQGEAGKLVEVEDEANHKTVEVWIE